MSEMALGLSSDSKRYDVSFCSLSSCSIARPGVCVFSRFRVFVLAHYFTFFFKNVIRDANINEFMPPLIFTTL